MWVGIVIVFTILGYIFISKGMETLGLHTSGIIINSIWLVYSLLKLKSTGDKK